MNVCQKILYQHAILNEGQKVATGDVICVAPDWILASEAAWYGMDRMYTGIGRPGLKRPDRFWLAGDHVVDPRVNHLAKQRELIERCDRIAKEMGLGDNYRGHNTTIMHTEYYRQRVLPGMLVIGADSHTGSSGCLGALAIGMGITDVVIQLVTGETYIQVPQVVRINLVGVPPRGMGGKDVILGILGQLKRNTVAAERLVEFTGPGLQYLSADARFAICNMTTEFGGIGACVVPDGITAAYVSRRKTRWRKGAIYFAPDENAEYAESCDIDLSKMETLVALYPSPDNVVPISQVDLKLDGCFIGACTTTEEELVLAGMVVQECLKQGMKPRTHGLRRVTPGALTITNRLEELGLLDAYAEAGFVIGAPGCSYCVGMGPDQASEGEVWLSSQNRNFRDRMGKGSIGNLSSAAAVAVSSFTMKVTDPQPFIDAVWERFKKERSIDTAEFELSEPSPIRAGKISLEVYSGNYLPQIISGKVQRFGDSIDTDSVCLSV
jgi:homoaconitate hydratase